MRDDVQTTQERPLAPDFAFHGLASGEPEINIDGAFLDFTWPDGLNARFHALWLRENEVTPGIIDAVTREREIEIDQFPIETHAISACLTEGPAIEIEFGPERVRGRFDPGWLRSMAERRWEPDFDIPAQVYWQAPDMPAPHSFDGAQALSDDDELDAFLTAVWRFGFARLRGLPTDGGTVQKVGERIGTVRSSNFGFLFTVETKPDPDSSAYRSVALDGHTDLASRETQPGIQMLLCRENSAEGGASTMTDGFAVAEAIRASDPDAFAALTTLKWVFTNRHRNTDYRFSGPIVELDETGRISEIRNTGFLRAFPDMPPEDMSEAYRAIHLYTKMARSAEFMCKTPFAPGDLVAFDNRRMLHGRDSFDPQSGVRRLEGCYMDRDEILSCLRILARRKRFAAAADN